MATTSAAGPTAITKNLTLQIDGQEVNAKDRVFGWFKEQHRQRNPDLSKPVVCLMDGERALWSAFKKCFAVTLQPRAAAFAGNGGNFPV